jgi:hypothetical protein
MTMEVANRRRRIMSTTTFSISPALACSAGTAAWGFTTIFKSFDSFATSGLKQKSQMIWKL